MKRYYWIVGTLIALPQVAMAEQVFVIGEAARLGISGFVKQEIGTGTNRSEGLTNCNFTPDPRGVLGVFPDGAGPFCQPGKSSTMSSHPLNLFQVGLDLSHEFDSAWKIDGRLTLRERNGSQDIYGERFTDKNVGISHPIYGELRIGTQLSRSWSRSDSFSYPIGLSSPWSESGQGYGVFRQSVRYTASPIEIAGGKLVLEGTAATNRVNYAKNAKLVGYDEMPAKPQLGEFFAQFGNASYLIEYIFQANSGGAQSSFAKGAFSGDVGNADNLVNYRKPRGNVHILQGDHYFTPNWKMTAGLRRNYWSGVVQQCDFADGVCYFPSGFSNGSDLQAHPATSYDVMGGLSYFQGPWTYTVGVVRLNKAYTKTPTEYGQSNTATFTNLGVYRKIPEINNNLSVYGGLSYVRFGNKGPAPLSMPNELAFGGVDPRTEQSAAALTLGVNFSF
jgi:hypothetical protein